jgi:hypothetical protein
VQNSPENVLLKNYKKYLKIFYRNLYVKVFQILTRIIATYTIVIPNENFVVENFIFAQKQVGDIIVFKFIIKNLIIVSFSG